MREIKTVNCTTLINPTNRTIVFDVGWQAIPETIVFNLILFLFFLIIFIILRRLAWDRKHVNIRRTSKGWLQSIYGDRKLAAKAKLNREESPIIHHKHDLQIDVLVPPKPVASSSSVGDMIERMSSNGSDHINTISGTSGGDVTTTHQPEQRQTALGSANGTDAISNSNLTLNGVVVDLSDDKQEKTNQSSTNDTVQKQSETNARIQQQSDNILGASFDFANIPTNIQATFTEVGYKLSDVLLISNKDILASRGNDALQYLLFQQYILYFMALLSIFCMLVVLPVNLQGQEYDVSQGFARTTLLNLPEDSPLYWVHVVGASIISLVGIFMMHRFSKVIKLDEEQITRRTLLIRRIPKDKRNKELLGAYFQKAVPNCVIEGIQSVYDVRKLIPLTNELTNLVNARCYCIEYLELKGKRLQLRPSAFGEFGCLCGCCCERCRKTDGIQFYTKKEEELQQLIATEMNQAVSHPTGGFFITFRTERMAQEAFVHLRKQQERAFSFCPFSNTLTQVTTWCQKCLHIPRDDELDVARWMVSYAPFPDDINWCDITVNFRMQWFRSIVVSLLLVVLFVFMSTPLVILNASDTLQLSNLIGWLQYFLPSEIGSKVPELIGPLILVIAASALPAIVTLACQYISYVNTSAKNHAIMWKVYLFLLLMVIIWPSLGWTSLKAFLLTMLSKSEFPWNCLFPVKIGSFFVNYTIQAAFLGNIMELMRLSELLIYIWYIVTARSRAEVDTASRYVVWDFSIGIRYPRFLLIFAMVVTYSVSCPLITVAGLVYMVIKHLIDRYNIYYVYNPSKINSKIHSTAIMFVHIAFLMMQAQIFTVTLVRTGYSRVFGLALFVFLLSLLVFSGHFFFYMFRNINHLTYRATRKLTKARREYCACSYLPPVLYNLTRYTLNKSPSGANTAEAQNGPTTSHSDCHQPNANGNLNGNSSSAAGRMSGETQATGVDSLGGSSQLLLVPTIDTSDAYFLSGSTSRFSNNGTRPKFSRHTTLLSTRQNKSRRTASDGQQQFHPSRLVQYEELQLKRTSSDLDKVI
uniref:Transmembrane protein 63A n=1 Tax=Aceria tosichella TaxID=561515 RepID=A0A6G1SC49_9ACAR